MNYLEALFQKRTSEDKLKVIKCYINTIIDSDISFCERNNERLLIYRYTDDFFSIVKTILTYPDGHKEISFSIVLPNNKQVYDGRYAININSWFNHLKDVYNMALESEKDENENNYSTKEKLMQLKKKLNR